MCTSPEYFDLVVAYHDLSIGEADVGSSARHDEEYEPGMSSSFDAAPDAACACVGGDDE